MIIKLPSGQVVIAPQGRFGGYRPIGMPLRALEAQSRKSTMGRAVAEGFRISEEKRFAELMKRRLLEAQPVIDVVDV